MKNGSADNLHISKAVFILMDKVAVTR